MSRLDELRHIADLVGIATRHVDALGVVHEPGEEILSRLIAAFGLPSDPQQAKEALAEQDRVSPFGLAPVEIVAQEDPAPVLHLRLSAQDGGFEWHCRLEDGGQRSGRSDGAELLLPAGLPLGYHRLAITGAGATAEIGLAVAPDACHLGAALQPGARSWGLTTQLYGLRSARDWGIGAFGDLASLCHRAGALGAAAIGINPPPPLFAPQPPHFTPHSPPIPPSLNHPYIHS